MATGTGIGGGHGIGPAGTMPHGTAGAAVSGFPEVSNFVPPLGTAIGRTDVIQFDVTDDSGAFTSIDIEVRFADGSVEQIFDFATGFTAQYAPSSARVAIANGFRFFVRRIGGWLQSPVGVATTVVDAAGNCDGGLPS